MDVRNAGIGVGKVLRSDNRIPVLFFGDQWDDMWRRRQQLAWRLSQTDLIQHVLYIERPLPITSLLKFLVGRADRDGTERWRRVLSNRSWVMPLGKRFSVLTTFAPLPPVGLAPLYRASERARDSWLLRRLGVGFDLNRRMVWVSHPQISVDVIQALEPCLLWYDCTEHFSAVPWLPDCMRAQIEATDHWLTEHADVVTAVSRTLCEEKQQVNPNTHWLPNAVDTDLFLQPPESFPVPLELQGVPRPILVFVGGLNEWAHDWELLDKVAALQPEWTMLLIGPLSVFTKTQRMLQGHPNILCVGQKPYWELPAYLTHSDVCFQFYRLGRGNDTRNSQKLFLYLAAGKPVVSTPSADVESYRDFVEIAETPAQFVKAVENMLVHDRKSLQEKRLALARENSWDRRVQQIMDLITDSSIQGCQREG